MQSLVQAGALSDTDSADITPQSFVPTIGHTDDLCGMSEVLASTSDATAPGMEAPVGVGTLIPEELGCTVSSNTEASWCPPWRARTAPTEAQASLDEFPDDTTHVPCQSFIALSR